MPGLLKTNFKTLSKDGDNRQWLIDAGLATTSLILLGAIFWHESSGALRVWMDSPTFNHCFLIFPISLFMMWERRHGLALIPHVPQPRAALFLLPLSFAWLLASFASVLEAEQLIVITMLQVMLLSVLGWQAYRRLIAPFLFLYFLVPSGAELVPALQQITAHFAVLCLKLIGIPVYSDGAVIEIPAGSFAVAEACAGLRFLIATVAFGVFYATEIYRSVFRRLVFIGLSLIVPIIANGLRVFGLIAAAQWIGSPTAALADHLIYGWGFFSLVLILLIFVGRAFSDKLYGESDAAATSSAPNFNGSRTLLAGSLCVAAVIVFPVISLFPASSSNIALPGRAPGVSSSWQKAEDDSDWKPVVVRPDRTFSDAMSSGGQTIYRFVALYSARGASDLLRSENRVAEEKDWKFDASRAETLPVAGRSIPVTATTIANGSNRLKVWSFYVVGGEIKTSALAIKFDQLRARLLGAKCISAFVAIATQDDGRTATANAMAARYLGAMQSLPNYLCDGTRHSTSSK